MNDANEFGGEPAPANGFHYRESRAWGEGDGSVHPRNGHARNGSARNGRARQQPAAKPIDGWFVAEILLPRLRWVLLAGVVMACLGWCVGMLAWKKTFTATAQLMRYEPMATGDFFKPQPISQDTFASLLKSPRLLEEVGRKLAPPLSAELLNKCVLIKNESDSDIVKVLVKAYDPAFAVNLANLYAGATVDFTRELQKREAENINRAYVQDRVTQMDKDVGELEKQFRALPQSALLTAQLNRLSGTVTNIGHQAQVPQFSYTGTARMAEKLQNALDDLATLTQKYTDAHPAVQAQRAKIEVLENELKHATNTPGLGGTTGGALFNPDYEIIQSKLRALSASRQLLADRQQEAKAFIEDPPGDVRFFAPATIKDITPDHRWMKVGILTILCGVIGVAFALGGICFVEFMDGRLKTASDVERVTKLPVIAALDNLDHQTATAREQWAFRTWTMLQGRLSPTPNHGLVCGITSSGAGEGRSTWINLLADAAGLSGFRVLTIATRPANGEGTAPRSLPTSPGEPDADPNALALTTNALSCPSEVTEQLTGPNARPSVHIPLPGWVWNLERRKQWQEALEHWRKVENLVILVELPPGSAPEAVLLGENVPNIVWLTDSGKAQAAETRQQLETFRHARCNFVGAVLNREPSPPLKSRFPRWLGCMTALLFAGLVAAQAQTNETNPNNGTNTTVVQSNAISLTNLSFSITSPDERGQWQKHLTLGSGDVIDIALYGQSDLTRNGVLIGPDGRVNYLEAQNVLASGLTVDELRTNLDHELSQYRRAPRTIITPVAYRSKRYFMLGRVVQKGVYVLDRPITVVEAVARAHGLETGLSGRNSLDLADFQRCFLMRNGKRIPLNFENLFGNGDLSQNIPIEPNDYLYFPPAGAKEVYVLGEVRLPGVVPYTPKLTVISALSARGGFTDVAYKTHVMVLRGSFSHPQLFTVDTEDIMYARSRNFQLQPHDIIFVSGRPFLHAEQLFDLALSAFLQSMTAEWTGKLMGAGTIQ